MSDTAQSVVTADPNAQIAAAANAFKTAIVDPVIPRDEAGRFTPPASTEELISEEGAPLEAGEVAETSDEGMAAEEAQPEPVDMPASWSNDDAALWADLPPETQAKIAEREGQRETAVNRKFQEAANVSKAAQAELATANANRDAYGQAINEVLSVMNPQEPDPRHYGAGTGNYDREGYDLAVVQYRQNKEFVESLKAQREQISAQQAQEEQRAFKASIDAIEEVARPNLLAAVPELSDPVKAAPALKEIVDYAISKGLPPETFQGENAESITSAELLIVWEAMQYRKIMTAKTKVAETPPPKVTPSIRPGTAISRSANRSSQVRQASAHLAREGTVQAGAAIFKNLFKG